MSAVLTFSEIVEKSYKGTKSLLKTYLLGALLLFIVAIIIRLLTIGAFSLATPAVTDNLVVIIVVGFLGICLSILGFIVQLMHGYYALVIAVDRKPGIKSSLQKTLKNLWRLLVGGIWMMLRSFAWVSIIGIPFIAIGSQSQNPSMTLIGSVISLAGVVCGIIFLPRLMFTNIIQLKDSASVRKSAALSLVHTHGYWGKIVGNSLLLMLAFTLVSLAMLAILVLLGFLTTYSFHALGNTAALIIGIPIGLVVIIAAVVFSFGIALFMQVFMVELYLTIRAHPRKAS